MGRSLLSTLERGLSRGIGSTFELENSAGQGRVSHLFFASAKTVPHLAKDFKTEISTLWIFYFQETLAHRLETYVIATTFCTSCWRNWA